MHMANAAPGFKKFPNHRIRLKPVKGRVRVKYQGHTVAETTAALALEEPMGADRSTVAPIVYYIPRKDVKTARRRRPIARSRATPRITRSATAARTSSGATSSPTTR